MVHVQIAKPTIKEVQTVRLVSKLNVEQMNSLQKIIVAPDVVVHKNQPLMEDLV